MIESEIAREQNLWDDPAFIDELDQRSADYESGKAKGSSWEEVKAKSEALKLR